jgi:hypothetical protein
VLRDEIYGNLRFPFVVDYKVYEELHVFDSFPQNNVHDLKHHEAMMNMHQDENIRREIYHNQLKSNMVSEIKKLVDNSEL